MSLEVSIGVYQSVSKGIRCQENYIRQFQNALLLQLISRLFVHIIQFALNAIPFKISVLTLKIELFCCYVMCGCNWPMGWVFGVGRMFFLSYFL